MIVNLIEGSWIDLDLMIFALSDSGVFCGIVAVCKVRRFTINIDILDLLTSFWILFCVHSKKIYR